MNVFSDKLELAQLFESLNREELAQLEFRTEHRKIAEGEYLVRQGEQGTEVFLILAGTACVEAAVPGRDEPEVLAELSEGEFVGEMVLLGRCHRIASVRAEEELEVLVWKKSDLDAVLEQNHHIGYVVMRNLATMLCERLGAADISLVQRLLYPERS